jgi:outer membrane protein assembly factor BamA
LSFAFASVCLPVLQALILAVDCPIDATVVGPSTNAEVRSPEVVPDGNEESIAESSPSTPTPATSEDAEVAVEDGAIIGHIEIRSHNIFNPEDPNENRRLFRFANKLHRRTRPATIQRMLLFKSGDPYDARTIAESERILRATKYLYDAKIRPVAGHDDEGNDTVDVVVETRDVWTLVAGFGFGRAGGTNHSRVALEDTNFLGYGKDLSVKQKSDVDRTSTEFRFVDEQLFSSRLLLHLEYTDSSDGQRQSVELQRPFFSLDARWATGGQWQDDDREDTLYSRGDEIARFRHLEETASVFGGWSRGRIGRRTARWRVGFSYEKDRFLQAPGEPPDTLLPDDRTLAFPWIQFSAIQDAYEVEHNLNWIARSEDYNLGRDYDFRLGFSSPAFGGDVSRIVYDGGVRQGLRLGPGQLFLIGALSGRSASGTTENLQLLTAANYYVRDWGRNIMYFGLRAEAAQNLDGERQLLLGGDNGLRGYPLRYTEGDRAVLLTVEQRFYTDWHPWQLFRVGAAVFMDAGKTWWASGGDPGTSGEFRDVGFGVRLSSSRTSHGAMLHIDLAFPLDGAADISSTQLLIGSKDSF